MSFLINPLRAILLVFVGVMVCFYGVRRDKYRITTLGMVVCCLGVGFLLADLALLVTACFFIETVH